MTRYKDGGLAIRHDCKNAEEQSRDMETPARTPSPPSMPRVAKVGHKKSRLGCQRCKVRRVKVSVSVAQELGLDLSDIVRRAETHMSKLQETWGGMPLPRISTTFVTRR